MIMAITGIAARGLLTLMLTTAIVRISNAQPSTSDTGIDRSPQADFLVFPAPVESMQLRSTVGFSMTVLPRLLVEESIRQTPLLSGRARLGLPFSFGADFEARTNVLTNRLSGGLRWGVPIDRFAVGARYEIAYWFGFASFEGFDIRATGWLHTAAADLGVRLGDVRSTLSLEVNSIRSLAVTTDGIRTDSPENRLAGYAANLSIEQPFWGDQSIELGMRVHFARSLYQAWLAFSTFDEALLYPEFHASFIF